MRCVECRRGVSHKTEQHHGAGVCVVQFTFSSWSAVQQVQGMNTPLQSVTTLDVKYYNR